MASIVWRKSLTKSTRFLASRPPLIVTPSPVKRTIITLAQSITVGPSPTVFKRTHCTNQPGCSKALELEIEEQKKKLEMEKEIEEQSKNEKEREAMQPEEDIKKDEEGIRTAEITELYNTSQKILIVCFGDFELAHHIASTLGDARNIVVVSRYSFDDMKGMYENAESHVLELTKLGANVHFNVLDFSKDSRIINNKVYDRVIGVAA